MKKIVINVSIGLLLSIMLIGDIYSIKKLREPKTQEMYVMTGMNSYNTVSFIPETCGKNEDLQQLFDKDNKLYFHEELPPTTVILRKDEENFGSFVFLRFSGRYSGLIYIAPKTTYPNGPSCNIEELYGETMIHEMAHAWVHYMYPDATEKHGPLWKMKMRRLAGAGALDSELWTKEDTP